MNAAKVSTKTDVVLFVNPGGGVSGGDGLVNLKVRLLFGEAGELVQVTIGSRRAVGPPGSPVMPIWLAISVLPVKIVGKLAYWCGSS